MTIRRQPRWLPRQRRSRCGIRFERVRITNAHSTSSRSRCQPLSWRHEAEINGATRVTAERNPSSCQAAILAADQVKALANGPAPGEISHPAGELTDAQMI